jgi:hypothetical protein
VAPPTRRSSTFPVAIWARFSPVLREKGRSQDRLVLLWRRGGPWTIDPYCSGTLMEMTRAHNRTAGGAPPRGPLRTIPRTAHVKPPTLTWVLATVACIRSVGWANRRAPTATFLASPKASPQQEPRNPIEHKEGPRMGPPCTRAATRGLQFQGRRVSVPGQDGPQSSRRRRIRGNRGPGTPFVARRDYTWGVLGATKLRIRRGLKPCRLCKEGLKPRRLCKKGPQPPLVLALQRAIGATRDKGAMSGATRASRLAVYPRGPRMRPMFLQEERGAAPL